MKCVLIFSRLDVVFIDVDAAFKRHVEQKATEAELITDPGSQSQSESLDPNVVLQLFSPLINSQRFMIGHLNNAYSAVRLENGFLFVFQQFGDHVYLAVNGDGTESEEFLHRKLSVLHRILGFLYGPVSDEGVQSGSASVRRDRWRFLSELLQTWCILADSQQSYLVEAIEQLNVSQGLSSCCIQLLESAMSRFRAAGDRLPLHAMLIVNAKLLALYSSRSAQEVQPPDILLIILLARQQFPSAERLEDLFSTSYRPHSPTRNKPSFSVPLAPRNDPDTYHSLTSEESSNGSDDAEQYFSSTSDTPELQRSDRTHSHNQNAHIQRENSMTRKPLEQLDNGETSLDSSWRSRHVKKAPVRREVHSSYESLSMERDDHIHLNVLLQTAGCPYTPHALHCIEVMPNITLVIVSEVSKSKLSSVICETLVALKKLTNESQNERSHGRYYFEVIDGNIRKLKDAIRKCRGTLEHLMREMIGRYEQAKEAGLMAYLERESRPEMSSRLESCLSGLASLMKELFKKLYLLPSAHQDEYLLDAIGSVRERCTRSLRDYKEYLAVKAHRNFTITSYVEEFPGLVHFIYINRGNDQMIAPSINIASDEIGMVDISQILKDKIWEMVRWAQHQVALGSTSMLVKAGDFTYSYYLWYQDANTGQPVNAVQPYLGSSGTLPGILSGNFYRQMFQQCFPSVPPPVLRKSLRCTELICMHLSVLPSHLILSQMKRLAGRLWGANAENNPSISLL